MHDDTETLPEANAGAALPPLPGVLVPRVADRFAGDGALRDEGLATELRRLLAALAEAAGGGRGDETRAA